MGAPTPGVRPESLEEEQTAAPAPLDKVRDILFGDQIRDYDSRLQRLEERFTKESRDIREEIRSRAAALETFVHHEIQAMTERFKAERAERKEAIAGADHKMSQVEDQTAQSDRELRQQIFDVSNSLSEQLRRQHEELAHLVEKTAQELRHSKTDRTALAGFLSELAVRLKGEAADG